MADILLIAFIISVIGWDKERRLRKLYERELKKLEQDHLNLIKSIKID